MEPRSPSETLDISKALTFLFEDPDWVPKVAVGSLFALLTPALVGWVFLLGYAVLIARKRMLGDGDRLPEWDDLQEIAIDGLKSVAIWVAYKLPVAILGVLMVFAFAGSMLWLDQNAVRDEVFFYGMPVFILGAVVMMLLGLAIYIYVPAAYVRYIRTGKLSGAFDVFENVQLIRDYASMYTLAVLTIWLAMMIAQLGIFALCIGIFPALFWSSCVFGYVVGELARAAGGPIESTD